MPAFEPSYEAEPARGDRFEDHGTNPWTTSKDDATSTFAVDVDSASYTIARRALRDGRLPDPAGVRVEELVNYLRYDDPRPAEGEGPFAVHLELAPSPFGPDGSSLLRVGLQTAQVPAEQRAPANLVFLIDVSGSMMGADRLGLVKYALSHLVDQLSPADTLGIVVYAGTDAVLLDPTEASDKSAILDAIAGLEAGGSTNGAAGLTTAYALAGKAFREGGVNRVVWCTDGDLNVGVTGDAMIRMVEGWRDRHVFLTVLGFGAGNLNDADLEQAADHGDGAYAYVDSRDEALRVLGTELVSTLQVVAKDVKVQVTFDPAAVERWRLVGYEDRVLDDRDFADDTKDGGDVGAGHQVTALYELDLADGATGPVASVAVRHQQPEGGSSAERTWSIDGAARVADVAATSPAFRGSAAVAEFAEILRHSEHAEGARFGDVAALAAGAWPEDGRPKEATELLDLIDRARKLWPDEHAER